MIGKVSCKNCASLDKKRKEVKPDIGGRYYYGCLVQGTIHRPIESDQELERQSCNEWEASDGQKRENGSMAEEFEQELQVHSVPLLLQHLKFPQFVMLTELLDYLKLPESGKMNF